MDRNRIARREAIATARAWLGRDPVFVDTETTGLGPEAEIVEVAILDAAGEILLESLVRPTSPVPPDAQRVHGIGDEDVEGAPHWPDLWPRVLQVVGENPPAIYNAEYDLRLMAQSLRAHGHEGISLPPGLCIMKLFAQFRGVWSPRHGSYRWHSLDEARRFLRLPLPNLHRATADAALARAVLHAIAHSRE